ncbi:MAG: hypothetical protein E7603_08290 [Ruminococcaceae bacterium]|nr:hypothetical protein [Oscillospiraceae bacterium]
MKDITVKISAMLAMFISLFSFALLISAFIASINEVPPETGVSKSFALWVFAVITSMVSLIFYTVDAILSAIKIFLKIHPLFNCVLTAILIGSIPMAIYVGGSLGINIFIWFAYYLLMFVLEIISIIKHIKMIQDERKKENIAEKHIIS